MADSSCSGSTPFKSLVEHGAEDRTLHRDRFARASGTQQAFRSTGLDPSAQAQAHFGAFLGTTEPVQVGPGTLPAYASSSSILSPFQHIQTSRMPITQHSHRFTPDSFRSASPQVPSAAATATAHVADQHNHVAHPSTRTSSWAQDFARFSGGVPNADSQVSGLSAIHHYSPAPVGFKHGMISLQPGPSFFRSVSGSAALNNAASAETDFDVEMDRWMAAHGDGRMEDVDAVMEQIARELEQDQQPGTTDQKSSDRFDASELTATSATSVPLEETGQRTRSTPVTEASHQQVNERHGVSDTSGIAKAGITSLPEQLPDLSRLGLDEASERTATEPAEQGQSQSEISEAARQILESVQHEQGDKWKNSRFLLLMKDFRDGNKDIVNNEILDTSAGGEGQRSAGSGLPHQTRR
ncbi:hypothetical protein CH063_09809 [Colletotrichum higginsianum]|uniref:Peroxin 20 n=1 Tax=Colletotrichum higginsianum (strain IMI 349063) TaxID=759273 RepID=H1VF12_COLHI|nr:Peroxin 20 [Colletotrichum higginsianum IMI 349063]OBR02946.1 Peroxin 20 [Colletotrichum higginsianum IMI 349063]CCF38815.1 hypothetical protein CH063_09809 [Colletotrichum higginsianum]